MYYWVCVHDVCFSTRVPARVWKLKNNFMLYVGSRKWTQVVRQAQQGVSGATGPSHWPTQYFVNRFRKFKNNPAIKETSRHLLYFTRREPMFSLLCFDLFLCFRFTIAWQNLECSVQMHQPVFFFFSCLLKYTLFSFHASVAGCYDRPEKPQLN